VASGKSRPRQIDRPEGDRRRRRPRGGEARARADPAQGRDGYRVTSRQAGGLSGKRSDEMRTVHGGGRCRRRRGPTGQWKQEPGARTEKRGGGEEGGRKGS